MTQRRASPTFDPAPWHRLREFLTDAYSNAEMRTLAERTLLAQGGALLPDERVSPQEYATTLCGLIQRHSGSPRPDFWRQLAEDRPFRRREIGRLQGFFIGEPGGEVGARSGYIDRGGREGGRPWPRYLAAVVVSLTVGAATYCASAPDSQRSTKIMCNDGTRSPNCDRVRSGCCSGHGGVLESEASEGP